MLDFGGKPDDFGWEVRNGILKPVMYKCKIAAEEVQGLICDCKGNKKYKNKCSCYNTGLLFIDLCVCSNGEEICNNPKALDQEREDYEA